MLRLLLTFFTLFLFAAPVYAADQVYFEAMIGKNQDAVLLRVVPLSELGGSASVKRAVPLMEQIELYDRKLPFVSYSIRKPQEFEKYLDGQISQEAQKLGIPDFGKITPAQAVHIAARVTNAHVTYEDAMVQGVKEYDLALDDRISEMPLDEVFMGARRGVCRQFAALFEAVLERIVAITPSPQVRAISVDEVASLDLNHAYNVVYVPTIERGRTIIEVAFVEPIARSAQMTIQSFDASDTSHDGLIAELTSARFTRDISEKETLYWMIATSTRSNAIMQKQAETELLTMYNTQILQDLMGGITLENSRSARSADAVLKLASEKKTTDRLDQRFNLAHKIYGEVLKLAPQQIAHAR